MLLTSSQVSVLLTCGMVLLCTSALFISGCLIQQRTLRDLRTAIRPAVITRPKPKIWDTEALKRGQQQRSSRIRLEDGSRVQIQQYFSPHDDDAELVMQRDGGNEFVDVEIRPSESRPDIEITTTKTKKDDITTTTTDDNDDDERKNKNTGTWDGVQEGGEPLSRAERRRRIKAEIERLSKGNTPVHYQRRLW